MASSDLVDISGLSKPELLFFLWENAPTAAFFKLSGREPPAFSKSDACTAVLAYIDYFYGRCIKCDLSRGVVDPFAYDRDAGPGTFAAIVALMRVASA